MTRATRIDEAARAVVDDVNLTPMRTTTDQCFVRRTLVDNLDAALALPADDGEVVERATAVIVRVYNNGLGERYDGWSELKIAEALAAAGLLARPMDRERLAWLIAHGLANYQAPSGIADAILREWGGGK